MNKIILASVIGLSLTACQLTEEKKQQIGSTLNEKYELALEKLPASALAAILKMKPDFIAKEAEKEIKHGKHYLDIEGVDKDGNEIEFDMLEQDGMWKVVEVQRDLTRAQTPKNVLAQLPADVTPKRIIESDQTTGVVVYEFYTVAQHGVEKKYEVKLENGIAKLLDKEWAH